MVRLPALTSASTLHFGALFVFACLVLFSVVWFFADADMNHRVKYTGTTEDFREAGLHFEYETLTHKQRHIFSEAVESGRYVSDEPFEFPEAVERNGTFYQFSQSKAFDWTDSATYQPALVWLIGLAGMLAVLRRDIRR